MRCQKTENSMTMGIAQQKLKRSIALLGFTLISTIILGLRQLYSFVPNDPLITTLIFVSLFVGILVGITYGSQIFKPTFTQIKGLFIAIALLVGLGLSTLSVNYLLLWSTQSFNFSYWGACFILLLILATAISVQSYLITVLWCWLKVKTDNLNIPKLINYLGVSLILGLAVTLLLYLSYFGIAWTNFLNSVFIIFGLIVLYESFSRELISLSVMISIILISYGINIKAASVFNNSTLIQTSIIEALQAHQSNKIIDNTRFELLATILFQDLQIKHKHILVIGNNNVALSQISTSQNYFTFVDLKSADRPNACAYFNMLAKGDSIYHGSSQSALQKKYDIIIANLADEQLTDPRLLSYQHFQGIRQALADQGIAILDILAKPTLNNAYSKEIDNTIRQVFPNCVSIPFGYQNKNTQILYLCKKSLQENNHRLYE